MYRIGVYVWTRPHPWVPLDGGNRSFACFTFIIVYFDNYCFKFLIFKPNFKITRHWITFEKVHGY